MSKYWTGEWPNLGSISISIDGVSHLSATEIGILYRLVWFYASQCVYTQFSEPSDDPGITDDAATIRRLTGCTKNEWASSEASIRQFFAEEGGRLRLVDESVIRFTKDAGRSPIPASTRAKSLHRDGARCVYCGDDGGPFHFDHLWPVSKGGSNDASNIVIACVECNLSKGGKTLAEWVASR